MPNIISRAVNFLHHRHEVREENKVVLSTPPVIDPRPATTSDSTHRYAVIKDTKWQTQTFASIPPTLEQKQTAGYVASSMVSASNRKLHESNTRSELETERCYTNAIHRANILSDPEVMELLGRANQAINITRTKLQARGNVRPDIERTGHQSTRQMFALHDAVDNLPNDQMSAARQAAMATVMGSGSCGDYANMALCEIAGKLENHQRAYVCRPDTDHEYVILEDDKLNIKITIDPWARESAMLAQDNGFFQGEIDPPFRNFIEGNQGREYYHHYKRWESLYMHSSKLREPLEQKYMEMEERQVVLAKASVFSLSPSILYKVGKELENAVAVDPEGARRATIRAFCSQGLSMEEASRAADQYAQHLKTFLTGEAA